MSWFVKTFLWIEAAILAGFLCSFDALVTAFFLEKYCLGRLNAKRRAKNGLRGPVEAILSP